MQPLLLFCTGQLLFGLVDLQTVYYTLLSIVETIGLVAVLVEEYDKGINFGLL